MSFFTELQARVREVDSLLCVGLDPHPDDLSKLTAEAARDFCINLILATHTVAAAFKPNIAFFEAYGPAGIAALQHIIVSIPKGIPVIMDAKRGDIASTAEAYVQAIYQVLGAHAVTINPYLGRDSIEPFITDPEKGVFLLCKTSNPGAGDIQDLVLYNNSLDPGQPDSYYLYEKVALLAKDWNVNDNLGLVVGATHPEALARVRALVPDLWILAPGVGIQGGDLEAALQAGLRPDGMGLLIPVSRGISRSSNPMKAAEDIRKKINECRKVVMGVPQITTRKNWEGSHKQFIQLADGLLEAGCIKFGQFTLKSGSISPIYIDLRQLVSYPKLLEQVALAYMPILSSLTFDQLAGLPYAALPIATVISIKGGWPLLYPRKEAKTYGTKAEIEGIYSAGQRVVVIDDLATTGVSKFEAIQKLTSVGIKVEDVVVLIDRQSGAAESLSAAGCRLHSVTTLTKLLDYYEESGKVPLDNIKTAREFLSQNM